MGRKTDKPVASTSNDEGAMFLSDRQQGSARSRKARAMAVLGEYMRYFGAVNGLYRNMVHMQAEVVSKHGRSGWKSLSQEDQDLAFNKHIMKNSATAFTSAPSDGSEENSVEVGVAKQELRNRRDSLQSITDQDCFSGPFSWKSKSLQDLAFPATPDANKNRKQKEASNQPKVHAVSKLQLETAEGSGTSESEDEVMPSMTLDQLRKELRKNYSEQQAARLKLRQLEAERSFGFQKKPEEITKAAVRQRNSPTRNGRLMSDSHGRLQISPADLKAATALRPVNREGVKSFSENSSPAKADAAPPQLRSPPAVVPRAKSRTDSVHNSRHPSVEHVTPKRASRRKSADFDEILQAAEASHRRRVESNVFKYDTPSRCEHDESRSEYTQKSGSVSIDNSASQKRMTVKEISDDWNEYYSQRGSTQSPNGNENSDIMDLFKNW